MSTSNPVMLRTLIVALVFLAGHGTIHSQVLRGTVTDSDGNPLSFATVYVPGLKKGTAANANGDFVVELETGDHLVRFQYLGYRVKEERVRMRSGDITIDVVLEVEPVQLKDVTVMADREDPAYTIMRKAIAKAKYHTQQLDSFTATAYIKGSGRLKGVPGLFRKTIEKELAKEGIDTSTAFASESVSIITYKRPNQYDEKVVSIRTVGDDMNTDPVGFVQSSFYEAEVNNAVSPLSPRAFAYYKFEYLGDFADQGFTINKIRVTPRSRGENVFEGTIYIVDNHWSIHSLDLDTYLWGIKFNIQQIYQPVQEHVWMPMNQIYNVSGGIFGFKFEFQYFVNMSDYVITLNPDLDFVPEVIDDKLFRDEAKVADAELPDKEEEVFQKLNAGEEVSRKELKKLMKEYEKQEQKEWEQDTMKGVTEVFNHEVDSMAYQRDSIYWTEIRPIPLTEFEVKGYRVQDSIAVVREEEEEQSQDSVSVTIGSDSGVQVKSRSNFRVWDIVMGGSYKLSGHTRFAIDPLIGDLGFNTVEGFYAGWGVRWYSSGKDRVNWSFAPEIRYGFANERVSHKVLANLTGGAREHKWAIIAEGGRFPVQFNSSEPIHPMINTFWTLLFEQNYLKMYEKEYVLLGFQKDLGRKYSFSVSGEYANNREMYNHSDWVLFDSKKRDYTPNAPYNASAGEVHFPNYNSTVLDLAFEGTPWLRYRIRNGRKSEIPNSSPTFSFQYQVGLPDLFDSDVSYHHVGAGVKHTIEFPGGGILNFNVNGGIFFGEGDLYFPQWKHFDGNRTPFATADPAKSFRMLDYYLYSTDDKYATLFANYQFRKLLATQIFEVRLLGIKESFFLNVLETPESEHYMELGYGLNYIFRIFRLELVTAWEDFKYQDFAVRIGIAANLDNLFD